MVMTAEDEELTPTAANSSFKFASAVKSSTKEKPFSFEFEAPKYFDFSRGVEQDENQDNWFDVRKNTPEREVVVEEPSIEIEAEQIEEPAEQENEQAEKENKVIEEEEMELTVQTSMVVDNSASSPAKLMKQSEPSVNDSFPVPSSSKTPAKVDFMFISLTIGSLILSLLEQDPDVSLCKRNQLQLQQKRRRKLRNLILHANRYRRRRQVFQ
jgi:hypothetical protein